MGSYDFIIVGAGVGGLSLGNFLTKYGKKVLIVEKHAKPGGQLGTFKRNGFSFDSSIFHLNFMSEREIIRDILGFWNKDVPCKQVFYHYVGVTKDRKYVVRSKCFEEDLIKAFPQDEADIKRFFKEVQKLRNAIKNMKTMKPPFKMDLKDKVSFVLNLITKRRLVVKYTGLNSIENLNKFFKNQELVKFIYSLYPVESLSAYYHLYGIGITNYYPKGGMQTLAEAIVDVYKGFGGELKLNTEVKDIILRDGKAVGIRTIEGEEIYANAVVSNVSPHYTFSKLVDRSLATPLIKDMIENRRVFESFCFVYLGMDKAFKMKEDNYIIFPETVDFSIKNIDCTPEDCPISIVKYPDQDPDKDYSMLLAGFIPYEYNNCWGTNGDKIHDEEYRKIKLRVQEKLINRAAELLGEDFKKNIKFKETATPLSFEKYSNVEKGAVMGWSMMGWKVSFKMLYIPYETSVKDLYLVGQFTFPSGGIPGVLSSGYYLACELLEKDGIDLYKDFRKYRGLI